MQCCRSTTCVVVYLMLKYDWDALQALRHIRGFRPVEVMKKNVIELGLKNITNIADQWGILTAAGWSWLQASLVQTESAGGGIKWQYSYVTIIIMYGDQLCPQRIVEKDLWDKNKQQGKVGVVPKWTDSVHVYERFRIILHNVPRWRARVPWACISRWHLASQSQHIRTHLC